jgi:tetratricopeptide (TPR) repeat protein
LAELAMKTRDWKTAEPQLQALIQMEPKNAALHNNIALAMKGQGRFADAKKAYEQALAVDPGFSDAKLNLGVLALRHLDDPVTAQNVLEQYLSEATRETKQAEKLLNEARMLIKAKEEEKRMMEEMQRQEEEQKKKSAEQAPPTDGAPAPTEGGVPTPPADAKSPVPVNQDASPAQPTETVQPKEEPRAPKPAPKKSPPPAKKPPPEPTKEKTAPANDDEFFED